MRRLVGLALLTGALVACSSGGGDSPDRAKGPTSSSSATTTTAPKMMTSAELEALILPLADMPTGWSTDTPADLGTPSETDGYCGGPNAVARAQAAGSQAFAGASYIQDPTTGPAVRIALFGFPSTAEAEDYMALTQERISACTTFTDADASTPSGIVTFDLSAVNYPRYGDETIALREIARGEDADTIVFTSDVVFVRKGAIVATVQQGGLSVDVQQLQDLVAKQIDRLPGT